MASLRLYMVEQMAAILQAKEEWEAASGQKMTVEAAVNKWADSGLAALFRSHYDSDEEVVCKEIAQDLNLVDPKCRVCLRKIAEEYQEKHELVHLPENVLELFFRRKYVYGDSSEPSSKTEED
tara:strand:+ start:64 stop:432 length:369 start_codon:yes stop_codon:yes gene_type:complete